MQREREKVGRNIHPILTSSNNKYSIELASPLEKEGHTGGDSGEEEEEEDGIQMVPRCEERSYYCHQKRIFIESLPFSRGVT